MQVESLSENVALRSQKRVCTEASTNAYMRNVKAERACFSKDKTISFHKRKGLCSQRTLPQALMRELKLYTFGAIPSDRIWSMRFMQRSHSPPFPHCDKKGRCTCTAWIRGHQPSKVIVEITRRVEKYQSWMFVLEIVVCRLCPYYAHVVLRFWIKWA